MVPLRLAFLLILLALPALKAAAAETPPNIVFLLADDLGRADCGFMGGKEIATPNLDKLGRTGRFWINFTSSQYAAPPARP